MGKGIWLDEGGGSPIPDDKVQYWLENAQEFIPPQLAGLPDDRRASWESRIRSDSLEMTLEYLGDVLGTTIKHDRVNKIITFLGMLLTYTEQDQLNIGFNADSSTGKSYIALEIAKLFPQEDVIDNAYVSPTAFFHEYGEYNKITREKIISLHQKIFIFLDQPHDLLLQRLRPLLSHDKKELNVKITDRGAKGDHRTKNIRLVGFPTVVFCSTSFSLDEQERTRLLMLSPESSEEKVDAALDLILDKLADRDAFNERLEENEDRQFLRKKIKSVKRAYIHQVIIRKKDIQLLGDKFLKRFSHRIPRLTRDLPRLIALAKAWALLNHEFRLKETKIPDPEEYPGHEYLVYYDYIETRRKLLDEKDYEGLKKYVRGLDPNGFAIPEDILSAKKYYLYAEPQDIDAALELYGQIADANERGLPPAVYQMYVDLIEPLGAAGLTRRELAEAYYQKYYRTIGQKRLITIIRALSASGLVVEDRDPDDKRRKLIYPAEKHSPPPEMRPQRLGEE